jgi:hypothetical protein
MVCIGLTCGFVFPQWLALLLLMAGATVSQISGCEGSVLAAPVNVRGDSSTLTAVALRVRTRLQ